MNWNDWTGAATLAGFSGAIVGGILAPILRPPAAIVGIATAAAVFVVLASLRLLRSRSWRFQATALIHVQSGEVKDVRWMVRRVA